MKNFVVPCFVVVQADNLAEAVKMTERHRVMRNGSVLRIDESLPAVETAFDMSKQYPSSMTVIPELTPYFQ